MQPIADDIYNEAATCRSWSRLARLGLALKRKVKMGAVLILALGATLVSGLQAPAHADGPLPPVFLRWADGDISGLPRETFHSDGNPVGIEFTDNIKYYRDDRWHWEYNPFTRRSVWVYGPY